MRTAIAALVAAVLLHPAVAVAADESQLEQAFEQLSAKAKPPGRPDSAIHDATAGAPSGAAPCASNPTKDVAKKCLRLAELPPPPLPTSSARPTLAVLPSSAPFAGPSRSWLGSFSKYVVNEIVDVAEALYTDRDNWRGRMASEVQWELQQRQKGQSTPK